VGSRRSASRVSVSALSSVALIARHCSSLVLRAKAVPRRSNA
jgi:hypothetical protein